MSFPEFLVAPVKHVRAKQIASCAQGCPVVVYLVLTISQLRSAVVGGFNGHVKQASRSSDLTQKAAYLAFDLLHITTLFPASICHRLSTLLKSSLRYDE
ncbi:hypothetical protein Poly41_56680 [Novipirellula artificiosorum]|uniref:Uncharacterized protein n=1 Tax=Novipirellula artificiosorum TaxID=2528016 RepID=A0A5C6D4W5_9BACT|nr:hypothetical protein Poly41_56680 [Novipirellula artificiosorum]